MYSAIDTSSVTSTLSPQTNKKVAGRVKPLLPHGQEAGREEENLANRTRNVPVLLNLLKPFLQDARLEHL